MSKPPMPAWDDVRVAQPGRSHDSDAVRTDDMERIKAAMQAAQETFEDAAAAAEWLESPCLALGGVLPLQLLGTEDGLDQVLRELVRIAHGIPP
jgi:putative toxin-antitoxin system antitoxin component (TIGR02293 family)